MIAEFLLAPFTRWAAETIDGVHPRDPALVRIFGGGARTTSGVAIDETRALGYPALWRGVNILCNGVSKVPLFVLRKEGRKKHRDTSHPAYARLRRSANEEMPAGRFRKTLQHHALLWGNGYAHISRDEAGRPIELITLLPDRTKPFRTDDGQMLYRTVIGGQTRTFLKDNVLHIPGLGFDGMMGYPVVEILRESIGLGMAAREFGSRFFGQGANAAGIVTLPNGMDEEAEENFLKSIHQAHAGLGVSHRIMLLEDGAKFQSTTIEPEHAQFLQTREFEIREIANIIGVQPHKLGDPSRKSYNSLEQSNQEHLDDDLEPWFCAWEEECESKLLTEEEKASESHVIEFERKALMRTNLAARTSHYASGRQWGYYSANDVRALENMDDIGEQGDVYMIPTNMAPANAPITTPDVDDPPAMPDESVASPTIEHEIEAKSRVTPEQSESLRGLVEDTLRRIAKRFGNQARKSAKTPNSYCKWLDDCKENNHPVAWAMATSTRSTCMSILGVDIEPIIFEFVVDICDSFWTIAESQPPSMLYDAVDANATKWETGRPVEYSKRLLEDTEK